MLVTEREKIENTHYKLIRFEIKRPAEFIKKKLIESREQFDANAKPDDNILEERQPERKRCFSQENIANHNDDTLQGAEHSQDKVGGNALSQYVNGNDDMRSDGTVSEDSVIGGKIKELLYSSEDQLRNLNSFRNYMKWWTKHDISADSPMLQIN